MQNKETDDEVDEKAHLEQSGLKTRNHERLGLS